MKLVVSQQFFKNYSNIKFHEYLSSGSRVFYAGGRTDGRTDRYDELTVPFLNYANAPN
jgi:hypothetical protein